MVAARGPDGEILRNPDGTPQMVDDGSGADSPFQWLGNNTLPGAGDTTTGWRGDLLGNFPADPEVKTAWQDLLARIPQETSGEPEDVNALVQAMLGLSSLPAQQFFNAQFPGAVGGVQDIFNMASNRAVSPYSMPNVPDSGGATFYDEGGDAATWLQMLMGESAGRGIPQANLDQAAARAGAIGGEGLAGTEQAIIDSEIVQQDRYDDELDHALAAAGMSNSTEGDWRLEKRARERTNALADAKLRAQMVIGGEERANVQTYADVLNTLFGQQTTGTQLGMGQTGQTAGLVGQAETQRITGRMGEFQFNQTDYTNLLNALMMNETIANTRLGVMQSPLAMLLSTLAGVNVAPSVVPSLPTQAPPSTAQLFGQAAGNLVSNLPYAMV
jgi:hypothetical protein